MLMNIMKHVKKEYEDRQKFEVVSLEETKIGPYGFCKFRVIKDDKSMVLFSVKHINYQFPLELKDSEGDYLFENMYDLEQKMIEIINSRVHLLISYYEGK